MVAAGKAARRKRLKRRDPKKMMALRMKFVEQCKRYIGTPYKRKYHEPGTREYNSPLFLDCCALVRRAIQDLKEDFGFDIGPWNQTYMYDTLPTAVAKETSMKPGDLVFISGVYFNKKMKPQVHGIVHVEVWLGDGRKTIGARWHKGAVQIFDSYRFKSTSYHSMRYHFKSINPWLMGICKSHCPMHSWRHPGEFRPSKRSVLHVKRDQQQREQQQQNASDVDQIREMSAGQQGQEDGNNQEIEDSEGNAAANRALGDDEHLFLASRSSSEDSQETLMKDILLSGTDISALADKLRLLPITDASSPAGHKKSMTYIQVSKSISQKDELKTGCTLATCSDESQEN